MLEWITSLTSYDYNYENHKKILQFVPINNDKIKNIKYSDCTLIKSIANFAIEEKKQTYIVSLSGGVDSMVLAAILHKLNYNVIGCHINYNNRNETKEEQLFLEEWCKYNNIKLYVKDISSIVRGQGKRSTYEAYTRIIRFDFYKKISSLENCDCILLGHHKDDIVENTVANVCRGRNLLDLAVIKKTSIVNNIKLTRPMLDFYKRDILDFAHINHVPYFKDTTPDWSVRGKYRLELHNKLQDTFGQNIKENLLGLSRQSDEWNSIIQDKIINPFLDTVYYYTNGVEFDVKNYLTYPLCFWNIVFAKIFYRYGKNCPSRKGIITFTGSIPGVNQASLSDSCVCKIKNYVVSINFKT